MDPGPPQGDVGQWEEVCSKGPWAGRAWISPAPCFPSFSAYKTARADGRLLVNRRWLVHRRRLRPN